MSILDASRYRPTDERFESRAPTAADNTSPSHPALERHYRIGELAEMWKVGRETVRLLVKDEPGVVKIRNGRKRANTIYSVPESVAKRIHTRLWSRP